MTASSFHPIHSLDEALLRDEHGKRSITRFLAPLDGAPNLVKESPRSFSCGNYQYNIPKYSVRDENSSDPIRIGLFAAIHGDEPAGAFAAARFLLDAVADPQLIENFLVQVYPLCNPTGFEDNTRNSRSGPDLNRAFWQTKAQPEVAILENELRSSRFDGIIQLHTDDTSDGIYGFVRGHTLTENLLRPALRAAGQILPRNVNATIDGFAARDGIIYDHYQGVLAAPARIDPVPFEIILETPHCAEMELQVQALVVAVRTILVEYRKVVSFAANI